MATTLTRPELKALGLTPIKDFAHCREHASPRRRLEALREAARGLRTKLLAGEPASFYASFDLRRVPYPTRFALREACTAPTPFVHILNRLFVIQYRAAGRLWTLVVSPSDVEGNGETPFFKRLAQGFGPLFGPIEQVISPIAGTVESQLKRAGIDPAQVDYITYDHLHTQDLRRWLGTHDKPGFFPKAKLLVMRQEWESTLGLIPPNADWYCPRGVEDIPAERILLLDSDVQLGTSAALIATPGHTEGNHSVVALTPEGLLVTSENGVGPDAYAPEHSGIPGLRRYAQATGMEVVLNGNTLERSIDQYLSMVVEKELAGPSARDPRFPNLVSSSELTPYWLFPGITPSLAFGELWFGAPQVG